MCPIALPLRPEREDIEHFHAYFEIPHLGIFGGKSNGFENPAGFCFAIRIVAQLAWVKMIIIRMFLLVKVIQVGDFLLHLRVEISAHCFFFLSPLVSLHLLKNELSLLHALQKGH